MSKCYCPPLAWRKIAPMERAAHLYSSFESWRAEEICQEEGITEADTAAGCKLAQERRRAREIYQATYGSPEYGG